MGSYHFCKTSPSESCSVECRDGSSYSDLIEYDLILFLNSIYGISIQNILKLKKQLNKSGLMVFLVNSRKGAFFQAAKNAHNPYYTSEEFMSSLKNKEVNFSSKKLSFEFSNLSDFEVLTLENYLCNDMQERINSLTEIEHVIYIEKQE